MSSKKILSRSALARILARRGRKSVVFTNGCFDLLHVGHVRLFRSAKKLGDVLVVAVNSDHSLRKLKGSGRPLVDQKSRAEVLAALDVIDYVVIFDEDTPLETIRALKPDVLMKGGDYELSQIVGRDSVKKVVLFPLVKGISTTRIIQKILSAYGGKSR